MKKIFLISASLFFINNIFSQDCEVLLASIQGKYTGACKNKKAEGAGKAEGTDTYEGNFKSGYPSGEGTYTYKNGDFFTGIFKKGIKEGKGEFHYKKGESADSIIKGYWKNDMYAGLWLHPYELAKSSGRFTRLDVKEDVSLGNNTLTITSQNVIKSNSLGSNLPPGLPVIKYFSVDIGSYEREERRSTDKSSTLILYGLKFPFHILVNYETDSFDLLLTKEGSWTVYSQLSITAD